MSPYNPDIPDIQADTPAPSPRSPSASQSTPIPSLQAPVASARQRSAPPTATDSPASSPTVELDQKLVALRQRQKELEDQKNQLEEAARRKTEYHSGRKEMEENLIRGIGILDEELIHARRELALIEKTLASFSETLSKVQRLNHESWAAESYATELTRALTTLENARMEWNSARVKLPVLEPVSQNIRSTKASSDAQPASALLQTLESFSWSKILRLGLFIHWPILIIAFFTLLIFITLLFK